MDSPSVTITVKDIEEVKDANPDRINIDPENVEKGLARLVLTLVELIRKLMEKQAMKRVEAGSLSDEEIERVGETLMKLENKMKELKEIFDLRDEELNLNLGPLGNLM
ncbi:MAG: gas vesicle protein K [Nitrospirota bacterium]